MWDGSHTAKIVLLLLLPLLLLLLLLLLKSIIRLDMEEEHLRRCFG